MPYIPRSFHPFLSGFACAAVAACTAAVCASAQAAEVTLEKVDTGVVVKLDGKPFTQYRTTGPKPYLWPIVGPNEKPITRAFPMEQIEGEKKDHPHHRSFWFTHGDVNGVDFWSENKDHGSIKHREFLAVESGEKGVIRTANDWVGPDGKKHLEDETKLTFHVIDGARAVDYEITLKATAGDVVFGDTKEGSFGVRVPTVMDVTSKKGGVIMTSEGLKDDAAWGKPASWVDYHGPIDGQVVGIAILNHPSSFRYPTHWHVRSYGLFAANPFGLKGFKTGKDGAHTLKEGDSLTLRYRVLFHQGDHEAAKLVDAFKAYAETK